MTGHIVVHEEGSYRGYNVFNMSAKYWGSLEEQIRQATADNLAAHSSRGHVEMKLWRMAEDCEHPNPEQDGKFEGVDDLLDEWKEKNLFGLTWRDGDLYYRNVQRGYASIDLYAEFHKVMGEWEANHDGGVCLLNYMGTCCSHEECSEGSEDSGYEVGPCYRQEHAKEAQSDFWEEYGGSDD